MKGEKRKDVKIQRVESKPLNAAVFLCQLADKEKPEREDPSPGSAEVAPEAWKRR